MMKRASMALGVAMLMTGVARTAQADDLVTAKIPFAFVVNGTELPAGDYVLSRDASKPELLSIATADGHRVALVLSQRAGDEDKKQEPKLEFERIGKQMHLAQVTLGPRTALDIPVAAETEDAPRR